jgi:capsular polysaccharide biosynthesis protein
LVASRHAAGGWSVEVPAESIRLEGTVANCICDGWPIYGHWLVDVLPRIERLLRSGKDIDTFLFAAPETEWQRALIKEIGVDLERCKFVDTSKLQVDCDTLVFATYDRFNSEVRPELLDFYGRLLERHIDISDIRRDRRLFISRVNWSGSRILDNREEVEAIAEAAGFEVVRPETLPFVEQIKLFASAEMLAGECGSGLHNSLFSPAGTKVGVIQSNTNLNFLQAQIALWKDQEIYFCIGQETGENGRFEVNPADVRHMLHVMKG